MMTSMCPKCGKPLRPGTRFCGNCGATVAAVVPSKPGTGAERELSAAQAGSEACPHCGKPLREGAKFCNNCGKQVSEGAGASVSGPQIPQSAIPTVGIKPTIPPSGAIAKPTPSAIPELKPERKKTWIGLLVGLFSIICIAGIIGAYLYFRDPLGWFGRGKTTPTASEVAISDLATETPEVEEEPTATITVVVSDTAITPLETTPTVQVTVPLETLTAAPLTPTVTITNEVISLPRTILFEDNFDGDINTEWNPWGESKFYPSIKRGPEGGWLSLIASGTPGAAGVTSKKDISSTAGVEIEFEAQLNPNYPQFPMIFDWDPLNNPRSLNSKNPGVVHFEINTDKLILKAPYNQQSTCIRPINAAAKHKYFIQFVENNGITMTVEGNPVEPCMIPDIGQHMMKGRLTISGMGWVMYLRVTTP